MGKKKPRGKQQEEETTDSLSGAAVQSSRRKSKKDRLADPFFDEELPTAPTDTSPPTEEIDENVTHNTKPKKKNKREKGPKHKMPIEEDSEEDEDAEDESHKAGNLFSALNAEEEESSESEEDETPVSKPKAPNAFASLMDEDEDEEEEEETVPKKTSEKKKSKAFASAFAALEQEIEDEDGTDEDISDTKAAASNAFAALEDEDDVPNERVSKKKSKKKKTSKAFDHAFAALEDEESGNPNADENLVDSGQKVETNALASLVDDAEENDEETVSKKKPRKKKASAAIDSVFAALGEDRDDVPKEKEEQPVAKGKKSKGKKDTLDFDALMDAMADDQSMSNAQESEQAEPALEIVASQEDAVPVADTQPKEETGLSAKEKKKAKKKKKGAKAQQETEDIDALLAEIDGKEESTRRPEEESKVVVAASETHAAEEKERSAEIAAETTPVVEEKDVTAETTAQEKATEIEDPVDDGGEATGGVDNEESEGEDQAKEVKLTAAQKKKLRKKEKKAKEKEKEAHKSEKAAKAKEEKTPAHVRKIQEQLEKKRLEEEKRRLEEEAEKARIAEEERLKEEAERQKEEEARKKAEAKAKKEELKKQGLLLTKKQKAEQARMAVVREQLLKNAGISRTTSGTDRPTMTPQEQKRIQREREEEKRRIAAEKEKEKEEQLQKEAAEKKRQEALLAEQKKQEEEERKRREEEDAIADNWEDISEGEEQEEAVAGQETASEDDDASDSETESGSDSTTDSDTDSGDASSSYSEDSEEIRERQIDEARKKVEARIEEAKAAASADHLRSPICCILGHVDTGKTKILDNIRRTNVQDNEAGGITQQIGATYIPSDSLQTRTADLRKGREYDMKVPGLLVIDTPGHESFTNLRTRGSSLCDIAILVVDLMHGLEAQTVESIELLRQKKTPFIIALNKVDRLNDWKVVENAPIRETLNRQKKHTMLHFEDQLQSCTTMLMERGLNVSLYWKNKEPRRIVNMVPTSAITGEGIPDMLQLLIKLTTSLMAEKLMFLSEIQCSVLEVKAVEGLGTTIDVVLVNGKLSEGDKIVVCGMAGPIVTTIRSLLTPHPLKELRVKGSYLHHKSIQAAQGIKLCAQNLEHAVAGTALRVVRNDDEEECKLLAQEEMEEVMSRIDKSGEGVSVQASTLGSLEALLEFLKTPEVRIPVSAIAIGPVHKKDVMRANVMNEKKLKKFAVVLAFDVPVTKEAREMAEELNVKIFTADIIYHLFDQFKAYVEDVRQSEKRAASADAVFPCILSIIPTCIFNKKDPIILGCEVKEGQARVGTPLVIPAKPNQGIVSLGRIESMELNHKSVQKAQRGDNVAVKIQSTSPEEASKLYGRHFDHQDQLVSHISRDSINALKAFFKDEMSTEDWHLVIKLKTVFQVD